VEDPGEQAISCQVEDDHAVLSAPFLSLRFTRLGDRWSHCLACTRERGVGVAWSQSISLPEDERRIISPVYQEVQRHDLAGGQSQCLLLTGLFFRHHFSAAVTLRRDPDSSASLELDFDIADRCRAPIESLAATYLVGLDSSALIEAGPGRIAWDAADLGCERIELIAEPPASLVLAEAGRQTMRAQVLAAIQPGTFTQRLRYRWRWTTSVDRTR
jgi:hypothetical protein